MPLGRYLYIFLFHSDENEWTSLFNEHGFVLNVIKIVFISVIYSTKNVNVSKYDKLPFGMSFKINLDDLSPFYH